MSKMQAFTKEAREFIWGAEEDDALVSQDISFEGFQKKLSMIPDRGFMDYIRKYIYWNVFHDEEKGNRYADIDDSEYRKVARESFEDNGVIILSKNKDSDSTSDWIKAQFRNDAYTASRQNVLLWAFGLNMPLDAASLMFTKANKEYDFYLKNPYEVICYYCLKYGLKYAKVEEMLKEYVEQVNEKKYEDVIKEVNTSTKYYAEEFEKFDNDKRVMRWLLKLTATLIAEEKLEVEGLTVEKVKNGTYVSNRVLQMYDALLEEYKNKIGGEVEGIRAERKEAENDPDWEVGVLKEREVNESEIVRVLNEYDSVPIQDIVEQEWLSGISLKWGKWLRDARFDYNTLRRNRTSGTVSRSNIITLVFLIYGCELKKDDTSSKEYSDLKFAVDRYMNFLDEVNHVLDKCGSMYPFYPGHPFEAFIALCMLGSEDPEKTYKVAMAKAIQEAAEERKNSRSQA